MRALLKGANSKPSSQRTRVDEAADGAGGLFGNLIADIHFAMNLPDNVNVPWTGPAGESLFREVLAVIRNGPGTCRGAAGA
jgi:hypothetical protein